MAKQIRFCDQAFMRKPSKVRKSAAPAAGFRAFCPIARSPRQFGQHFLGNGNLIPVWISQSFFFNGLPYLK
jgi:hypothetical protein